MSVDSTIETQIERLRETVSDTQALYREVCVLLFFRYGMTPTANKLYQLVRKGSMSAPAEALRTFWEDLREKSRVRIEQPDLPDDVKIAAGELVSQLWTQARAAADQQLEALHQAASGSVRSAQEAQQAAERETLACRQALDQAQQQLSDAGAQVLQLEKAASAQLAHHDALIHRLSQAEKQHSALEAALEAARRDFSDELEKQREALRLAEDRLVGTEKRALMEIERERQAAHLAQQEAAKMQLAQQAAAERQRLEIAEIQRANSEMTERLTQKLGVAEGRQQALQERLQQIDGQLAAAQQQSQAKDSQIALLQREIELREQRIKALEADASQRIPPRRRKNVFPGT